MRAKRSPRFRYLIGFTFVSLGLSFVVGSVAGAPSYWSNAFAGVAIAAALAAVLLAVRQGLGRD